MRQGLFVLRHHPFANAQVILRAFHIKGLRMNRQANNTVSNETKTEALKITRTIQKPGQTKEQSKLISQGIQKGIDLYKKQQKAKARDADRQKKKIKPVNTCATDGISSEENEAQHVQAASSTSKLPWVLLLVSWSIFAAYVWY